MMRLSATGGQCTTPLECIIYGENYWDGWRFERTYNTDGEDLAITDRYTTPSCR